MGGEGRRDVGARGYGRGMSLYLVRNDAGVAVWVAHEDDEMRIWTYVQNTGRFHLNRGVYIDFHVEHTATYAPITAEQAKQAIREGVGTLDALTVGHLVDRFAKDPAARRLDEILEVAGEDATAPTRGTETSA